MIYSRFIFAVSSFFITMTLFGVRVPFSLYAPFICLMDFPFLLRIFSPNTRAKLPYAAYIALFFSYILLNAVFNGLTAQTLSLIVVTLVKLLILIYLFFYFENRIAQFGLSFFYAGLLCHFGYVCYQLMSYSLFGGSLPLSTPIDLPFVIHDGGYAIADSSFSGSSDIMLSSIFSIRASGFTQEPSYLVAVCFPLLFTPISRKFKILLVFMILEALAKNALLVAGLCGTYFFVSRIFSEKKAFLITLMGTLAAFFAVSPFAMKLGSTFMGRFGPFYHYLFEASFLEKMFGVGMYNYSMTYGAGLIEEMVPPFGAFGGILIELGLVGFLFYLIVARFVFKSAHNKYLVLCIVGLLFSWGYFTAWPIWPFALAMDAALSGQKKEGISNGSPVPA